jgi:hypothetical protein
LIIEPIADPLTGDLYAHPDDVDEMAMQVSDAVDEADMSYTTSQKEQIRKTGLMTPRVTETYSVLTSLDTEEKQ